MLNILVTGSNGQLGSEIEAISSTYNYNFLFTNKNTLDITNKKSIIESIEKNSIDVIVNCAAYTAVDKAETEQELANQINHLAVQYLAEISKEKKIKFIHISTDYVFDGTNFKPYSECDHVNPKSIYGQSKLDGERILREINPPHSIIIRTSWVYSSFGANFVKTMLRLGNERENLGVIFDQVGTPTYARDLAKTLLDIIPKLDHNEVEIYNYSNEGVLSWYDFAKEIMTMAKIDCSINPIETKEYPTPAKRPHYSLLNKAKIKKQFNIEIHYWKDSLACCLEIMKEKK